jgi:p-aminobenzoyl-glutamate transporter AbgT
MSKTIPYINEIVSLTVMLLMVIALVAGQADATIHQEARADAAMADAELMHELSHVRLEDE